MPVHFPAQAFFIPQEKLNCHRLTSRGLGYLTQGNYKTVAPEEALAAQSPAWTGLSLVPARWITQKLFAVVRKAAINESFTELVLGRRKLENNWKCSKEEWAGKAYSLSSGRVTGWSSSAELAPNSLHCREKKPDNGQVFFKKVVCWFLGPTCVPKINIYIIMPWACQVRGKGWRREEMKDLFSYAVCWVMFFSTGLS